MFKGWDFLTQRLNAETDKTRKYQRLRQMDKIRFEIQVQVPTPRKFRGDRLKTG